MSPGLAGDISEEEVLHIAPDAKVMLNTNKSRNKETRKL